MLITLFYRCEVRKTRKAPEASDYIGKASSIAESIDGRVRSSKPVLVGGLRGVW